MPNRDSLLILIAVIVLIIGLGPKFTGFDCRFAIVTYWFKFGASSSYFIAFRAVFGKKHTFVE